MKKVTLWSMLIILLTGCATYPTKTRQSVYPDMYLKKPVSILILPPINNSTAVDAKEYFSCSLGEALGLVGYYPLPVEPVFNVLRDEGMYDTETITPIVLSNMKKYFGADAVLLTTIEKWDKSWFLTAGSLTIEAKYELLDTDTAQTLWDFHTVTSVQLGSSSSGFLMAIAESAIKTAMEDYFQNARDANIATMRKTLPYGKYHPEHGIDGEFQTYANKKGAIEVKK